MTEKKSALGGKKIRAKRRVSVTVILPEKCLFTRPHVSAAPRIAEGTGAKREKWERGATLSGWK